MGFSIRSNGTPTHQSSATNARCNVQKSRFRSNIGVNEHVASGLSPRPIHPAKRAFMQSSFGAMLQQSTRAVSRCCYTRNKIRTKNLERCLILVYFVRYNSFSGEMNLDMQNIQIVDIDVRIKFLTRVIDSSVVTLFDFCF